MTTEVPKLSDVYMSLAKLCEECASETSHQRNLLGARPDDRSAGKLYDEQMAQVVMDGEIFAYYNERFVNLAIRERLAEIEPLLKAIEATSKSAKEEIQNVKNISDALHKFAAVISFVTAVFAAISAPTPATIVAIVGAGKSVAEAFDIEVDWPEAGSKKSPRTLTNSSPIRRERSPAGR